MEIGAFGGTASRPLAPVDGTTFGMNHEDCCFYESDCVVSHPAAGACGGRGVFSCERLFSKLLFWGGLSGRNCVLRSKFFLKRNAAHSSILASQQLGMHEVMGVCLYFPIAVLFPKGELFLVLTRIPNSG